MKGFDRKTQVGMLAPDKVAATDSELSKQRWFTIFVVLWMGVTFDKRPKVYHPTGLVVEKHS